MDDTQMDPAQGVSKLLHLPLELLLSISEFLNESDIFRLAQVNRRLSEVYHHKYEQLVDEYFYDRSALSPTNSALLLAAEHNHMRVVIRAISEGADINTGHQLGSYTPLIVAAECGHTDIVTYLLKQSGIDVTAKANNDQTALHYAARHGHTDIVEMLLVFPNLKVNSRDNYEATPLILAAKGGHHAVVQLLESASAQEK